MGSYAASPSPQGTFDQGGNVWELTDEISGAGRRIRGGGSASPVHLLAAANSWDDVAQDARRSDLGFRVVPEPGRGASLGAGAAALCLAAARRRRNAR